MITVKKKILGLVLALAMLLSSLPAMAYSVRDAYNEFVDAYPEFVEALIEAGDGEISEGLIIDFLADIQQALADRNKRRPITKSNLQSNLVSVVQNLGVSSKYSIIMSAISVAFPDDAKAALDGQITGELRPLYNMVEGMIFDHDMLENIDKDNSKDFGQIVEISTLDPVTATQGEAPVLPNAVAARTDAGVEVRLPINWTDIPSTSTVGTFTASGAVIVPDEYELSSGLSTLISVSVKVERAKEDDKDDSSGGPAGGDRNPVAGGDTSTGDKQPVKHKYSFSDVTSDATVSGKAIYALSDMGAISGYPDGTFLPANPITRAEFTRIVVGALGIHNEQAQTVLNDVANDAWYRSYVASAVANGLISGYEDGSFRPANMITRAEVMTIVWRVLNNNKALNASAVSPAPYADDTLIPAYARDYVYALAANGVVAPSADNKITAEAPATREQCAVMLYNALVKLGKIK